MTPLPLRCTNGCLADGATLRTPVTARPRRKALLQSRGCARNIAECFSACVTFFPNLPSLPSLPNLTAFMFVPRLAVTFVTFVTFQDQKTATQGAARRRRARRSMGSAVSSGSACGWSPYRLAAAGKHSGRGANPAVARGARTDASNARCPAAGRSYFLGFHSESP